MAGAAHCSLQAKRLLLDPKFEGYKLSLEPLACYQLGLDAGEERARRGADRAGHPLGSAGRTDPPAFPFVPSRCSEGQGRAGALGAGYPELGQPGPQHGSAAPLDGGGFRDRALHLCYSRCIRCSWPGRPSFSSPGGFVVPRGL